MNYIDENLKRINQNKTIGIIICREENKYVIRYCSDDRIIARKYELVWYNKIGDEIMKKKNKLLIIISIGVSILFVILSLLSNAYYQKHESILECVHIIGPICDCVCQYQIGQEKIISIYKVIKISTFISIFIAFFTNIYILFVKKTSKLVKIISIVSIIFYAILIFVFMLSVFSS